MIQRVLAWVPVVVLMCGVTWLAVAVGDRSPATTDAKVTIIPSVVPQGEAVQITVDVFYRRSCWTYIYRQFYDRNGEAYPLVRLDLPPAELGIHHSTTTAVVSPQFAIGEGRYVSHPEYGCNWFQRWIWPMTSPERFAAFTVVARNPVEDHRP